MSPFVTSVADQIADRCGFRHPQYMAKLFKNKYGKPSGMFRVECQDF